MAVYVFVFQNIVIKKRSFYIFTIFRDSQLVFAPLKKTIIFRILCFRISDLYCQLTNYSWATILFWLSLPNGSINCFLMKRKISIFWNIVINCCSFLTLRWEWHQALIKKCRNLLLLISFPTQSPLDRMIDQSLLDFLGITPFEERLWSWKYCKLGAGTFSYIWHMIFSICVILDIILSSVSCNVGVADTNKDSGAICVISACCWFIATLETGTVYIMRIAVFWTWTCSVTVASGVSTRLPLSLLGIYAISGNFRLIPLVLVCSAELISKQICKKS